ncbi:GNAT family N-acetyltransferase [Acidipila sp. 4G-K13]|uniref:GNAT family N-acetyltransferase n=2 Tax=Paracidobacterium acidisoli TaxID=2303751 RepID=A0A372ILY2_9BACT|nr:GNAT family N-acetyltransferase [Paracidobacterium acidisoli]
MPIRIRPAAAEDVPLMLDLIHALAVYEREPDSVEMTEAQLMQDGFGAEPCFKCLIAEYEGVAAGFALFFPIYSTWQGGSLYLEDLFVKTEFRGRGIGKALLARVARVAVERKCARLQWAVLEWNQPAIDFYHSIGAKMLSEWRGMRVTGADIAALAGMGETVDEAVDGTNAG